MVLYSNTSIPYSSTYVLYIAEGSILVVFNGFFSLMIFLIPKLRCQKEFVIIGANLIFDMFYGMAHLTAGSYRLSLYYSEKYYPLFSKWQCFFTVHGSLFVLMNPGVGWINLFTCCNQFVAVFYPLRYIRLGARYAYAIPVIALIFTFSTYIWAAIANLSSRYDYDVSANCNIRDTNTALLYDVLRLIRIISTFIAISLYVPIVMKIFMIIKRSDSNQGINSYKRKQLIKMTITVLLITINQLCLFSIRDLWLMLNPGNDNVILSTLALNKANRKAFNATQRNSNQESTSAFNFYKTNITSKFYE